jgi:lipoate-protein ligase A
LTAAGPATGLGGARAAGAGARREPWRLLGDSAGAAIGRGSDSAPRQMAVDAALLEGHDPRPTLRCYQFAPSALSLGHFQRLADVPAARGRTPGLDLVRRSTGGGAIHHHRELTFAIAASLDHPLYRGPVADSYRRVHRLLAAALRPFGVEAELRGARELLSDRPHTGHCFHASHPLDLVWRTGNGWAKGVGSAQRRRGGRVVHHGSIKLAPDPLEPGVACLAPEGSDESFAALSAELVRVFAAEVGADFEGGELAATEREAAERLAGAYADPRDVARR